MGSCGDRFWAKVDTSGDCWLWKAAKTGSGYGTFRNEHGRMEMTHRFIYRKSHGVLLPRTRVVMHTCDTRLCVRLSHLRAGSQKENMHDMFQKGRNAWGPGLNHRTQVGEANHGARVTEAQVRQVLFLQGLGMPQVEVARQTGVTKANVWCILNGKSWTHITGFDTAAPNILSRFSRGEL